MFIREIRKKLTKGNSSYEYIQHRLVESIRTQHGPRQRTILNLGQLTIPPQHFKALADLIEGILLNCVQPSLLSELPDEVTVLAHHYAQIIAQKRLREADQPPETPDAPKAAKPLRPDPRYEEVDVNSMVTTNSRSIGVEHIALHYFKELNLFSILESCSFSGKEQVLAAAQICACMAHPSSERETARWLRNDSALSELLGTDFSHVSDQMLHRIADKLWECRETIEKKISENADGIFSLDNKIVLYDLTNTYFESPKRNSRIANYGHSKEKRNDCPLMTLALIVDAMGFPKRSMILEGNVSEPDTLVAMLEKLEVVDGTDNHPRTVVIDAGIATEENLSQLRDDPRFEYVAISRKQHAERALFSGAAATPLAMSHDKELVVEIARREKEFGEYIIRTSRQDLDARQLSAIHRTLTMIVAFFKWLKSDLGLRPNFHQKDARMCTHASISVLAYFVLASILHRIQWGGEFVANSDNKDNHFPWDRPHGWKGIVRTMSSQTRVTTAFTLKNGKRMNVRTTVEPTAEQLEVYKRLKVPPRPLKRTIQEL